MKRTTIKGKHKIPCNMRFAILASAYSDYVIAYAAGEAIALEILKGQHAAGNLTAWIANRENEELKYKETGEEYIAVRRKK